jgi:hypothetical protein
MIQEQIEKIETIINGKLIEYVKGPKDTLYTFQTQDNQVIFVEQLKHRKKSEPNYTVCTNAIDCWDGYDDARHVINHIKDWTEEKMI